MSVAGASPCFADGDIVEVRGLLGEHCATWGFVQEGGRSMQVVTRGSPLDGKTVEIDTNNTRTIASNHRFQIPEGFSPYVFSETAHGLYMKLDDESEELVATCERAKNSERDTEVARTHLLQKIESTMKEIHDPGHDIDAARVEIVKDISELRLLLSRVTAKLSWEKQALRAKSILEQDAEIPSMYGYDANEMMVLPMLVPEQFGEDMGTHFSITLPFSPQPTQQLMNPDEAKAMTEYSRYEFDPDLSGSVRERIRRVPRNWALPDPDHVKFLFGSPAHDETTNGPVMMVISSECAREYMQRIRWLLGLYPFPEYHSIHTTLAKITSSQKEGRTDLAMAHTHFRERVCSAWPQMSGARFPDPITSLHHCSTKLAYDRSSLFNQDLPGLVPAWTIEKLGAWAAASKEVGGWKSDPRMEGWAAELGGALLKVDVIEEPLSFDNFVLMLKLLNCRFILSAAIWQAWAAKATMESSHTKTSGVAQAAVSRLYYVLQEAWGIDESYGSHNGWPGMVSYDLQQLLSGSDLVLRVHPYIARDDPRRSLCTHLKDMLASKPGADNFKHNEATIQEELDFLLEAEGQEFREPPQVQKKSTRRTFASLKSFRY